ncbi:protein FAR1-RELATED SEQUENCE 5-like [Medicago truncatula]|uniref:protein FAR1-RELATED SEQUENCE 5-like n=1 Tax=Medicago truncatula TaxID=3880 RepID=UPI000D2F361E|nr:protein FAR1-RELATED SEQUENCE 5-like [Medicago truncatula]
MASSNEDWKPRLGMEFDTREEAEQFYLAYGLREGFGVRVRFTNRKKDGSVSSCRFVCCKEGIRKKEDKCAYEGKIRRGETRTKCLAKITLSSKNGKLVINEFVENHNHDLLNRETTHMLRSHRKITEVQAYEIDMADDSVLRQKEMYQLMSTHAGHSANVGFTEVDLLENPSFFYAYQMDIDEQITNVFWCDANMILDYGGSIIFGAALMYDETIPSFKWLFETFLQAHNNKKPKTIFTDQDQTMSRALEEVMPETHHGLCTWHLLQNGIKHLGNRMKKGASLLTDFSKCMYEIGIEADFEKAWFDLVNEHNLHGTTWINSVYEINKKWAACYMKEALTLGMRSTQSGNCSSIDSEESLMFVDKSVDEMFKKVIECPTQGRDNDNDHPSFVSYDAMQSKGFKKQPSSKGTKRHKSFLERQPKKRSAPPSKHAQSSRVPPQRSSQVRELTTNMVNGVSCSAPPTYEPPLARGGMFVSYTTMLMAPFDDTNIGALL